MADVYQSEANAFNWSRVAALSGAFAVHVFALALLATPAAPPETQQKKVDNKVTVEFIEPPPPPPPPVIVEEASPMSVAAPPPAPPAPPAPPVDIAPTENISYRRLRPPKYPPQAVRQRMEGKVLLKVLVGLDGKPEEITVEKSSGYRVLDQAAIAAVKTWVFNAGQKNGAASRGYALVPIEFNLNQ